MSVQKAVICRVQNMGKTNFKQSYWKLILEIHTILVSSQL